MAWEDRGRHRYYYESRKVAGRVEKTYLGRGPAADLGARLAAEARSRRRAGAADLAAELAALAPAESAAAALEAGSRAALEATLIAAGYRRQNYGPWRLARGGYDAQR